MIGQSRFRDRTPLMPLPNDRCVQFFSQPSESRLSNPKESSPRQACLTIPTTEPQATNLLWARVTQHKSLNISTARGASRGKGLVQRGGLRGVRGSRTRGASRKIAKEAEDIGIGQVDAAEAEEPWDSQTVAGSTLTSSARVITPRNPKFINLVLHPRHIVINETNSIVPSAFVHFGTSEPQENSSIAYTEIEGPGSAGVWIALDDTSIESVAAEYQAMKTYGLCDEEFATFAKEVFFKGERRSLKVSQDRKWRAERMLQLVCPPKAVAHWHIPPLLDIESGGDIDWRWDLRPDCSYWLSLKGFNPKYRFQIQNCTFVRDWITCPYLTIEFKRDGISEDVATAQVAAAGSLALYNRYRLHEEAGKASRNDTQSIDINLRHYGLTFMGPRFIFWVFQISWTGERQGWNGCTMTRLCGADCTDEYGVRELVDWINEIHRWGLSRHGPSCERNIKAVLRGSGVRTSDIINI